MKRMIHVKMKKVVPCPRILALFQKRIDGDDSLLELARLRFSQAGLGAEFYAETPEELDYLLQFRPHPETPAAVHLKRGLDMLDEGGRTYISDFAARAGRRVFGLVVHDQKEIATQLDAYAKAMGELDLLLPTDDGPHVFIEYASGLDTDVFIALFHKLRDLRNVSACIDTGHVGIWKAREVFSQINPGSDVCNISTTDQRLSDLVEDISCAVEAALPETLRVVRELAALGKPLHLHLHDGHPLSAASPFGVSDHMSFLDTVPLPFEFRGKRSLDLMYGPSGLSSIVSASLGILTPDKASFSLEIHPGSGRIPLDDASHLFDHWSDRTNAEKMNFWLATLNQNEKLIEQTCRQFYGNRIGNNRDVT